MSYLFETFYNTLLLLFSHQALSEIFATPWSAACQSSLSITSWSLFQLTPIESVMPSNHLTLCCPLLLLPSNFLSIRIFSNEWDVCIMQPTYWSFSFSISPSKDYSGLISFKMIHLILLLSRGFSRVFSNTTVRKHEFFSIQPFFSFFNIQLSHSYMTG